MRYQLIASTQSRTVQVARDCAETGVEISLWHMPPQGGGDFSPSRFFVELLLSEKEFKQWREAREAGRPLDSFADSLGEDDVDEMMSLSERIQPSGAGGFNAKECRMRRKEHKKRRLGSLTLHLNGTGKPGAAIAMGYASCLATVNWALLIIAMTATSGCISCCILRLGLSTRGCRRRRICPLSPRRSSWTGRRRRCLTSRRSPRT